MISKILIGNIAADTTEEMLREVLVENLGNVIDVTIPQDAKTHKHRGYAVVELPSGITASRAKNVLDGYVLGGRALSISIEEPTKEKRKWYQLGNR